MEIETSSQTVVRRGILEQTELTWHLSKGITLFERSTCGAILDKLELESCTSRKCRRCDGQGIVEDPFQCADPKDPSRVITVPIGNWCPKCKGTAVEPVFLTPEEQRLVDSGDWASSDKEGTRSAVPDEMLVRFAFVSRMLSLIPTCHRLVMELAYGDEGEELSHGIRGRAWAVMPLTPAGMELLRTEREREFRDDQVTPDRPAQFLISLAEKPKDKKFPNRKRLLAEAVSQAVKMLNEAEATWNVVVGGLSEKECAR